MPMPRVSILAFFALILTLIGSRSRANEDFVFHHENVMGTSLALRVNADNQASANWAEQRILTEIDRLSAIFSSYDPTSEFSRWSAQPDASVKVAKELFEVLQASDRWVAKSGGAFDPRVEALTKLWSASAKLGRVPTSVEIDQTLALMSQQAWSLDLINGTAKRLTACPITLNAIAKGDIVERATRVALDPSHGVRGLSLNVGGDLRVAGDLTEVLGIASPSRDSESSEPLVHIQVRNKAIATSGRSQRGLMIADQWYSHIFNPATGQPAPQVALATVIAESSRDADALATICNVLTPEAGLRLIESLIDVDALIVTLDGHVFKSKNWLRHERSAPSPLALPGSQKSPDLASPTTHSLAGHWGETHEVVIDFEVAEPEEAKGGRYRRPYVAVWIEDSKGFPARTLTLWIGMGGSGPDRWLSDLRRWYRPDEQRELVEKKNMVYKTARPTRSPGKYSLIWDGKDDNGKPLPAGDYTVYLESAREHGPYSITHKTVTIADTLFDEEIKGNVELKSAKVAYRRKTAGK